MISRVARWRAIALGIGFVVLGSLVAAWWSGRPELAVLGAAIAAVTAAFGPSVVAALQKRSARLEQLSAQVELPRPPSTLLDPHRGVVTFIGRQKELAALIAWCETTATSPVRLITGPGGVGKSRLAIELCSRLTELGWRCEHVAEGAERTIVGSLRQVTTKRTLLVVDYAETRIGLPDLLRATVRDEGDGLRLLMLARAAGDWWERMEAATPGVRQAIADSSILPLEAVVETGLSDAELVRRAVYAFAKDLAVKPPPVEVESTPGRTRILDIQAAALIAVLKAQVSTTTTQPIEVDTSKVMNQLLIHERRYWIGSAERQGLLEGTAGLTSAMLSQIVAAGTLLGAVDQKQTRSLFERVPGAAASNKVATWLRELYPPHLEVDGWIGSLHPDRLAERHVVAELRADDVLAEACLTGLDGRQARRAITVLGRASVEDPAAEPLLRRLLPLLIEVVDDLDADRETLEAISSAIPWEPTPLSEAGLAVARRITKQYPYEDPASRAQLLRLLGVRMVTSHLAPEAVRPAKEAVAICRRLYKSDPDTHRVDLARSVDSLSVVLRQLGRRKEAHPLLREAVELRRDLAHIDSTQIRFVPAPLGNLSTNLMEQGRPVDAVQPARVALDISRDLYDADPDRHRYSWHGR